MYNAFFMCFIRAHSFVLFPRFLLATSGSRAEEKEQSELSNQFPFAALWDF